MENSIGSKIRNIRNILGLSQTEFAEKLGYSCSLISKVEAGTRKAPQVRGIRGIDRLAVCRYGRRRQIRYGGGGGLRGMGCQHGAFRNA